MDGLPHRVMTDSRQSRYSRRSETGGSDHITRWNTAKDIVEGEAKITANDRATSATDAERTWSWTPGNDTDRRRSASKVDKTRRPSGPLLADSNLHNLPGGGLPGSRPTSTTDHQLEEAKKESRRLRRNLKESGDYLGVQGINPETGQLDIITPTDSDKSSLNQETQQKLFVLEKTLKDARHSYKATKKQSQQEVKKLLQQNEEEKLQRLEKGKEKAKSITQAVKWRRHTRQWSSAQEPELSPIAQSFASSTLASSGK